ncbi:FISUMP domain-containing protein [uncultured Fibrobacter sp.]|uniref:FISUMP domain-containing protein n=1 Tax=uncultured Fibrobacter sp. TaxID=261512 RepID=UPI0025E1960D|nr:FISUMP domain-containing protein [uncultured Fibrobacter sp.]
MRVNAKFLLLALCVLMLAACLDEGVAPRDIRGDKRYDIPVSSSSVASSSSVSQSSSSKESLSSAEETSSSSLGSSSSQQYTVGYIAHSIDAHYKFTSFMGFTWIAKNEASDCYDYWRSDCADSLGVCYDIDEENCEKYGRLYTWAEAMHLPDSCNYTQCEYSEKQRSVCTAGYHVATYQDWQNLDFVLEESWVFEKMSYYLKSSDEWNGVNQFEFNILPGGYLQDDDQFVGLGEKTRFWAPYDGGLSGFMLFDSSDAATFITEARPGNARAYIRCVHD